MNICKMKLGKQNSIQDSHELKDYHYHHNRLSFSLIFMMMIIILILVLLSLLLFQHDSAWKKSESIIVITIGRETTTIEAGIITFNFNQYWKLRIMYHHDYHQL